MKRILAGFRGYTAGYYGLILLLLVYRAASAAYMTFEYELIGGDLCNINNGQVIEVNFGNELITTHIDGVNYTKNIEYTLDCSEAGSNALQMRIQGPAALFDGTVLATVERPELGIAINIGNIGPLPVNTWFSLANASVKPTLMAVPVKAPGSTLQPGSFSAGATLVLEYQ